MGLMLDNSVKVGLFSSMTQLVNISFYNQLTKLSSCFLKRANDSSGVVASDAGMQTAITLEAPMAEKPKTDNRVSVRLRFEKVISDGIEKAVEDSPIEFADNRDFILHAIREELRRRKIIKTYK